MGSDQIVYERAVFLARHAIYCTDGVWWTANVGERFIQRLLYQDAHREGVDSALIRNARQRSTSLIRQSDLPPVMGFTSKGGRPSVKGFASEGERLANAESACLYNSVEESTFVDCRRY